MYSPIFSPNTPSLLPQESVTNAQNLIDRLLTKNGNDRLGGMGGEEVKSHEYFKGPITHKSRRSSGDHAESASSWT